MSIELHSQKREVWSIVYTSEKVRFNGTSSRDLKLFHKLAVVRYERDLLQSNFTELFTDLLDLREDNKEDYLLILALLHLNQNDTEKASGALQSLGEIDAYDLPGQENMKPGWASHTLSKRQQLYNQLSHELFSRGEYEGSIFSFLRYSKRLMTSNRIGESVNSLEKYLARKIQKQARYRLVSQFLEPLPLDSGYFFLWRDPDGWHLRWGGRKDIKLNVRVESSSKIRAVQKTMLEDETGFQHKARSLTYETLTQEDRIAGFDFQVKGRPKLTFDLSINQKIIQKVFFTKKEKMPLMRIPDDVTAYTGKSGRATLFIASPLDSSAMFSSGTYDCDAPLALIAFLRLRAHFK